MEYNSASELLAKLQQIHGQLEDEFAINNDIQEAKELQDFFISIERAQKLLLMGSKKISLVPAGSYLNEIIQLAQASINGPKTIFHKKAGGGYDNLEPGVNKLMVEAVRMFTTNTVDDKHFMAGTIQTENVVKITEEIKEQVLNQFQKIFYKKAQDKIAEDFQSYIKENGDFILPKRSIKVDIGAKKRIDISFTSQVTPKMQRILKLLLQSTFTLKNYASDTDLSIGETSPEKVFASVVGDPITGLVLGYYAKFAHRIKKPFHFSEELASHLNHVRYIYELSGYGQTVDKELYGDLNTKAKFLLFNKPGDDRIIVKAVSELVQQELKKEKDTSILKRISITQSSLL